MCRAHCCYVAGVPFAPVSVAYSLVSRDRAQLRHCVGLVEPGLVYVSAEPPFREDQRSERTDHDGPDDQVGTGGDPALGPEVAEQRVHEGRRGDAGYDAGSAALGG